ncbi:unnamed protein product [Ambrosiozyma monospora]|uniref:Unnamed protein product n=1 Tax=Ambrosiozyma monospora TaxID=43982 RepID=A0ACB5U9A4_AMBMO|nr:unnamed protein product [Ambrosiozyma monospora]
MFDIITQLPTGLQLLIFKQALINKIGDRPIGITGVLHHLIGDNPKLQEIRFDHNVALEFYFDQLVEFIDSKSITLPYLSIDDEALVKGLAG